MPDQTPQTPHSTRRAPSAASTILHSGRLVADATSSQLGLNSSTDNDTATTTNVMDGNANGYITPDTSISATLAPMTSSGSSAPLSLSPRPLLRSKSKSRRHSTAKDRPVSTHTRASTYVAPAHDVQFRLLRRSGASNSSFLMVTSYLSGIQERANTLKGVNRKRTKLKKKRPEGWVSEKEQEAMKKERKELEKVEKAEKRISTMPKLKEEQEKEKETEDANTNVKEDGMERWMGMVTGKKEKGKGKMKEGLSRAKSESDARRESALTSRTDINTTNAPILPTPKVQYGYVSRQESEGEGEGLSWALFEHNSPGIDSYERAETSFSVGVLRLPKPSPFFLPSTLTTPPTGFHCQILHTTTRLPASPERPQHTEHAPTRSALHRKVYPALPVAPVFERGRSSTYNGATSGSGSARAQEKPRSRLSEQGHERASSSGHEKLSSHGHGPPGLAPPPPPGLAPPAPPTQLPPGYHATHGAYFYAMSSPRRGAPTGLEPKGYFDPMYFPANVQPPSFSQQQQQEAGKEGEKEGTSATDSAITSPPSADPSGSSSEGISGVRSWQPQGELTTTTTLSRTHSVGHARNSRSKEGLAASTPPAAGVIQRAGSDPQGARTGCEERLDYLLTLPHSLRALETLFGDPSMFKNSRNVQITGGTFTAVTRLGGIKQTGKDDSALQLVREHSELNCLLDSNERFDPPRCDPDTRIGIIRQILDWVGSDDEVGSITVMHGSAGAGKSALEQSIAELCSKNGRLAASFFFSRTAPHRRDGNALIPTLVFQIAHTQPILRPYIEKAVERDPALFEKSRSTQLEKLLVEPFHSLNDASKKRQRSCVRWPFTSRKQELSVARRLVVIDGLDECQGHEVQCDLLRIIGEIVPRLPFPFRFLIASRPESHIMHTLTFNKIFQDVPVHWINLDDDLNARSDIHTFLTKQFMEIRRSHPLRKHLPESWPMAEDMLKLVEKASTQFIYISIVMNYVASRRHRPDHRLRVILGLLPVPTMEKPFAQLDALYSFIFSSVEDLKTAHRILGIIYLSSHFGEKFNLTTKWMTPVGLEEILQIQPGDVEIALDDLLSLIVVISRDQPIKILHASLFDFLLDVSRSEGYLLDLALAHDALANYYLGKILSRCA
ncbi:hypothetical protein NLJ89_g1089 [Agrocybe chaxingu]|uniref:Nephrocystin 3-like N-terminal domain-containing protein n=1 Tax=Agrocybe chaxingu TaxID=84603 RepID=A0A9W8N0Q0_9AGAR|nr:hypothetical protein NLJ89_g1089 [Agrocybe chaxingu]